jgi:hypothetical protein
MMNRSRPTYLAFGASLSAAALAVTAALPAQAAPGAAATAGARPAAGAQAAASRASWRIVRARHFGATRNKNGYDAVVDHADDAWFFGGTELGSSGGSPLIEHRLGGSWHRARLPGGLRTWIAGASAASPKSVWAVGHLGGYLLNWDSLSWTRVPKGGWASGTQFTGVDAITKKNVWVFGSGGGAHPGAGTWHLVVTGTAGTWTRVRGVAGDIYRASDLSPTSIWAIGGIKGNRGGIWVVANSRRGPSSLLHRSGTGKWTRVKVSSSPANQIDALAIVPGTTSPWGAGKSRAKTGTNAAIYASGNPG